ncbi:acyltransferase [Gordonia phthalatica]|uniref:Acetyltransferase n=1 Tax=Gordonia phthalatica TaxID=1136941 RepID=A0A0N9NDU4_9ACTN|nr:acyltransferase [Gordonia phthalatica]ALG85850.1 hypothetical protein ACH46_16850 [Gordonia phthalatica]
MTDRIHRPDFNGVPVPRRVHLGERIFNWLVTWFPSHTVRQRYLRAFGARIGSGTSIMMGTTVLAPNRLSIGDDCSIGGRCLLDARGGIQIEHSVVLASDVHLITAKHLVHADDFAASLGPITVGHHAWIASRATVLMDTEVGVGAVVGACSLVTGDVAERDIVVGVPAKSVGSRRGSLEYRPVFRPVLC